MGALIMTLAVTHFQFSYFTSFFFCFCFFFFFTLFMFCPDDWNFGPTGVLAYAPRVSTKDRGFSALEVRQVLLHVVCVVGTA